MLKDVVGFFGNLCQFSSQNAIQMHKGEVDLFLVKLSFEWRDAVNVPVILIASVLSLLMLIMSLTSTTTVVYQFILLLC
jgi:hypothetical protein